MKGIPASPGIAIGRVFKMEESHDNYVRYEIGKMDEEISKLNHAVEVSRDQVEEIKSKTQRNLGPDEAQIFESHLMILKDPELLSHVQSGIEDGKGAPEAVKASSEFFANMFEAMDNPYMQERAADIRDVLGRVKKNLLGQSENEMASINEHVIILKHDLTPSDTAQMPKDYVLGFITEIGGATSHSAIMARTMEIPAVVGLRGVMDEINHGDYVVVDGLHGQVLHKPDQDQIEAYVRKKNDYENEKRSLKELVGKETSSLCGKRVELACNIGSSNDLEAVLKNDGEGVGLFRSEFLYMDRETLPTEEEQFESYRRVLEGLNGKPVIIRTLDVGGDKNLPYLGMPQELNPFLGYRAIRYCLDEQQVFQTQLRAILRASAFGKAKIMFPMISTIDEIRRAKEEVKRAMQSLDQDSISYDENIEIGMMVEIPAAAILSDLLAKEVDFFSIGTNDLVQYTLAVDRMNQQISHLYTPYHPAVLRLVKLVIENGHKEGIWVGMCGEAAGLEDLVPLWFAMGLDEFSVSPSSVLAVRKQIRELRVENLGQVVDNTINQATSEDVKAYLKNYIL